MEPPKPSFARAVGGPSALALLGIGVLGAFLSSFLRDHEALIIGLGLAWVTFLAGRILAYTDRPRGRGRLLRYVATGVALGLVAMTFLRAVFVEGPGWPWTPWWALAAGTGFGIYRSHVALLREARADDSTARFLGMFHPKDIQALVVLLVGYALLGVAGLAIFQAFAPLIPGSGRMLAIGIAVYGLQGARLLLRFAGEERSQEGAGVVAWLKANALQNAIVLLILVAYGIFRTDLAANIAFYPLVEFGLGVALFGFVLTRLRSRIKRHGATLSTASQARDHVRSVQELREAEYDAVARPVTRFIESGLGRDEYARAVSLDLAEDDPRAVAVRTSAGHHKEPPRPPALELPWALAAGAATTLAMSIAAFMFALRVLDADMPFPIHLGLLFAGFGVYAQQDPARSHHRIALSMAIAGAGVAILAVDLVLFISSLTDLSRVPMIIWLIFGAIGAAMLAVPATSSWRLAKRLREGTHIDARRLAPLLEHQNEVGRARKRAATMFLVALILLLALPWLADRLARNDILPADFPPFLDDVVGAAMWVVVALGSSALLRFYGLTRGRPRLAARVAHDRARRLTLHRTLMTHLERT